MNPAFSFLPTVNLGRQSLLIDIGKKVFNTELVSDPEAYISSCGAKFNVLEPTLGQL